jgi:hypothetical protein
MVPPGSPVVVNAPDNSGSDTFSRYKYQAKVAFDPYVRCTNGEIHQLVVEHVEDLILVEDSAWRMVQVKSRDGYRGSWSPSEVLGDQGPVASLWRSFNSIEEHRKKKNNQIPENVFYEMWLEGVVSNSRAPAAQILRSYRNYSSPPDPTDDAIELFRKAPGLKGAGRAPSRQKTARFLKSLRLNDNLPRQQDIDARNMSTLHRMLPAESFLTISGLYRVIIERIEGAMERPTFRWISLPVSDRDSKQHKVINTATCLETTPHFAHPTVRGLLRRYPSYDGRMRTTKLEEKMRTAGASDVQILHAKMLRANASERILAYYSKSSAYERGGYETVQDIELRLEMMAESKSAISRDFPELWEGIRAELNSASEQYDRHQILDRDAFLLLGALCDVSDQCRYGWRTKNNES